MDAEIKRIRNIGGKNPLLICRDFLNSNIKISTLGVSSNAREKKGQRGSAKTRKLKGAVQIGTNKARN